MIISFLLAIIFIILSSLHVFWAFGSSWGLEKAIPTKSKDDTEKAIKPGPIPCLIVALGLAFFALFYINQALSLQLPIPTWLASTLGWGIPSIFTLRAIGEFNYVGFFKKVKGTPFAQMDTYYYSPFCIFVGLGGFIVML